MNFSKAFKLLIQKMLNQDLTQIPNLNFILNEVMSLNDMKILRLRDKQREDLEKIKNLRKFKRCITL